MKKTVLLATMLAVVSCAFSQLNGDPKYQVVQVNDSDKPTGLEISDQTRELMDRTPLLTLSEASANTPLADVVDITESVHFPDIFNQEGGCCAQASGIAYTFTYEINRVRNIEYVYEDMTT